MTALEPVPAAPPPGPRPDNPHEIPGNVLQQCLDEAAAEQKVAGQ